MNDKKASQKASDNEGQNEPLVIRFIPSNGTEGMIFEDSFCSNCINEKFMHTNNHDDKQCEILNNALLEGKPCLNKDLKFDGWEWFRDKNCGNWDWDKDDGEEPPTPEPTDPNQLILFSFDEKIDELLKEQCIVLK